MVPPVESVVSIYEMNNAAASSWSWSVLHRPQIMAAGRYPVVEKSRGFLRRCAEHVALHHHEYEGALHIGSERFDLQPGDLTLTPANVESLFDLPGDGHHLCIHFQHCELEACEEAHLLNLPLHLRPGLSRTMLGQRMLWITDLYRRAEHADPARKALALAAASAGLQELILTMALLAVGQPGEEPVSAKVEAAVQTLVELIEARLRETLNVPDLADQAQLSQNYLARAFRARYGITVPHYVLRRRIELARHLLTTSRLSIKQVAGEVGLPDIQHFNKQFRRLTGVSPTAFRENPSHRPRTDA